MNKQPCYHRVTILFTATDELTEAKVKDSIWFGLANNSEFVRDSLMIEEFEEPEWGDPADLM